MEEIPLHLKIGRAQTLWRGLGCSQFVMAVHRTTRSRAIGSSFVAPKILPSLLPTLLVLTIPTVKGVVGRAKIRLPLRRAQDCYLEVMRRCWLRRVEGSSKHQPPSRLAARKPDNYSSLGDKHERRGFGRSIAGSGRYRRWLAQLHREVSHLLTVYTDN
jgi:hypothetical protein